MAQPTQPTRSAWRGAFTMWWKESAVLALMSATAVFVRLVPFSTLLLGARMSVWLSTPSSSVH